MYLCEQCFDAMTTHATDVSGWPMGVCDDCLAPPVAHPCWDALLVCDGGLTAAELALVRTARPTGEYQHHPPAPLFRVHLPADHLSLMGTTSRWGTMTSVEAFARLAQARPQRVRVLEEEPEMSVAEIEAFLDSVEEEPLSGEQVEQTMAYVRERLAQEERSEG